MQKLKVLKSEEKNISSLRRLFKHYLAVEFSLAYHLNVIIKYERIVELLTEFNNTHDFEKLFKKWQTKKFWIRFHFKDMRFYLTYQKFTINHFDSLLHNDIETVNNDCWSNILSDPYKDTVPFKEVCWTVTDILDRKINKTTNKVEYLIEWKSINGRLFPE